LASGSSKRAAQDKQAKNDARSSKHLHLFISSMLKSSHRRNSSLEDLCSLVNYAISPSFPNVRNGLRPVGRGGTGGGYAPAISTGRRNTRLKLSNLVFRPEGFACTPEGLAQ
jgi:hypothetical protein